MKLDVQNEFEEVSNLDNGGVELSCNTSIVFDNVFQVRKMIKSLERVAAEMEKFANEED